MPKKDENLDEKEISEVEETAKPVTEEPATTEDSLEVSAEEVSAKASVDETAESTEFQDAELVTSQVNEDGTVTVQPIKFASFEDTQQKQGEVNKNLEILMDIKLQMTVELGRTELPIKKVLELTRGSIIELEKVAGEPVELYANGKLVAHGEVVVIEDNFGLRITSITEPEDRLKGIGT